MHDKDFQSLARIHMLKVRAMSNRLQYLYDVRNNLKYKSEYELQYNGRINRSVTDSKIERKYIQLVEVEEAIKKRENELKEEIKKIRTVKDGNILIMSFVEKKSFRDIANILHMPKSTVHNKHNKALQNYFWKYLDIESN